MLKSLCKSCPPSHTWPGRRRKTIAKASGNSINPYSLLEVSRDSSIEEVRQAYLEKIKVLHPDVNDDDTTETAAKLNLAYSQLMDSLKSGTPPTDLDEIEEEGTDVFDKPDGPPTEIFINPFACLNLDPFLWRDLQDVVKEKDDPEEALFLAGLTSSENAVSYLSKGQLEQITNELQRMEETLEFEVSRYYIYDCLARADWANRRSRW